MHTTNNEEDPIRCEDGHMWMLFDELTTTFAMQEDGSTLLKASYKWKGEIIFEQATTLFGDVSTVSVQVAPWRREVTRS